MIEQPQFGSYDSIVIAVAHKQFIEMGSSQIRRFGKDNHILYDLKYALPIAESDLRL